MGQNQVHIVYLSVINNTMHLGHALFSFSAFYPCIWSKLVIEKGLLLFGTKVQLAMHSPLYTKSVLILKIQTVNFVIYIYTSNLI